MDGGWLCLQSLEKLAHRYCLLVRRDWLFYVGRQVAVFCQRPSCGRVDATRTVGELLFGVEF